MISNLLVKCEIQGGHFYKQGLRGNRKKTQNQNLLQSVKSLPAQNSSRQQRVIV